MTDRIPSNDSHQVGSTCKVIVLGDHDTGERSEILAEVADRHGAEIIEDYTFDPGEVPFGDSLAEVEAVVTAISRAIATGAVIWVPYPSADLGQEQNIRRLSLVLQRHGRNLLLGPHLWPCPTAGGMNEIDQVLRREVQTVDELDQAALAAGGVQTLSAEIEMVLTSAVGKRAQSSNRADLRPMERRVEPVSARRNGSPVLPAVPPEAPWAQRQSALKQFAEWMTERGFTQAAVAEFFNIFGHQTPKGRPWTQATVSALINGRYAPPAAA